VKLEPASLTRRCFASAIGGAALCFGAEQRRPNILWITCEDIGPQIGAYGDRYATTPTLDKLAASGLRYSYAWSNCPVCAPARTSIISGMYPNSTGAEHMRSLVNLPPGMKMYPQYLREAGYYTTNNSKEDYNLEKPGQVWDDSSAKAHWRNRRPGQPFFSIFNFTTTHESQIRATPHTLVHDMSRVRVPAYYPDRPEVRHDWAQYYDNITTMDGQAAAVLRELEDDGLAGDTIVFFYGDHGPGMPRCKRWPYNSGLQVPVIVHFPDKFRHLASRDYVPGGVSNRLISFVDLAPTVLSLAGIEPPRNMHGRAFLGPRTAPEPSYLFGLRGRMDERYDLVRSARDRRYIYIRNFMPHRTYAEHIAYLYEMPSLQAWKKLNGERKLNAAQSHFWQTKPPEELYDLEADPDEVDNLARLPQYAATLERFRRAQEGWMREIRDVGLLPEPEMHVRSAGSTPYQMGHDEKRYNYGRVRAEAAEASALEPSATSRLARDLADPDSGVRYWAASGLMMRGSSAVSQAAGGLRRLLEDSAPSVRIAAAEALGQYGTEADVTRSITLLLDLASVTKHGPYLSLLSLNSLDALGDKLKLFKTEVEALPLDAPSVDQRIKGNIKNLIDEIRKRQA
jgi:uncharacterized sulfatase